jgi:hypothetical protein
MLRAKVSSELVSKRFGLGFLQPKMKCRTLVITILTAKQTLNNSMEVKTKDWRLILKLLSLR